MCLSSLLIHDAQNLRLPGRVVMDSLFLYVSVELKDKLLGPGKELGSVNFFLCVPRKLNSETNVENRWFENISKKYQ